MPKIVIIDDEIGIRRLLSDSLKKEGYETVCAEDGLSGIEAIIKHKDVDLILLDIRMPKLSGLEAVLEIKEITEAPILFLTALDSVQDELKGLSLGADDYITKPFNYDLLFARIKVAIRRYRKNQPELFEYENLSVDLSNSQAYLIEEGKRKLLPLSPREFEILEFLIQNINLTISRTKILDRLWGYDYYGDPRTVDTHIKTLRSKLGEYGYLIRTVRGVGYRFEKNDE